MLSADDTTKEQIVFNNSCYNIYKIPSSRFKQAILSQKDERVLHQAFTQQAVNIVNTYLQGRKRLPNFRQYFL